MGEQKVEESPAKNEAEKKPAAAPAPAPAPAAVPVATDGGAITAIYKIDMHCEGCAKKIKRAVRHVKDVESVKADCGANKLTVIGKMDVVAVKQKLELKTKKKVEIISPQPKKDAVAAAKTQKRNIEDGRMISVCSARTIQASPSSIQLFFPRNRRRITSDVLRFSTNLSTRCSDDDEYGEAQSERIANYAGIRLEETVDVNPGKVRLDSWISCRINGISRARVQSSIRAGLVSVNGRIIDKVSHNVKAGDMINCTISELQPLRAEPEDIDLDIVYEDAHVLVVNKPAHMVVHPAPGNATGTLVNAILNHCSLPMVATSNGEHPSDMDISDDEFSSIEIFSRVSEAPIRPGIVHRLDKGTSGLLVVAKDEHSHAHLSAQFKQHSIERVYISLTCGVPPSTAGRIEVPICRDPNNRIRMAAVSGTNNNPHAKHAASRYKVMEILAQGGSSLVEWRLETGRTHQS